MPTIRLRMSRAGTLKSRARQAFLNVRTLQITMVMEKRTWMIRAVLVPMMTTNLTMRVAALKQNSHLAVAEGAEEEADVRTRSRRAHQRYSVPQQRRHSTPWRR